MAGQRNAIDGRIVEIVAEMDRDELCGATGARSVAALVAWKLGSSSANAAHDHHRGGPAARSFPAAPKVCGRAGCRWIRSASSPRAPADGSDEHYAQLARGRHGQPAAHRGQARTAPEPDPDPPRPEPQASITKTADEESTRWRITLPHDEAATFDAALQSHRDALIAEWKRDHDNGNRESDQRPPMPNTVDAFLRLVEAGWDAEAARRPHGQHTTVVVHVDVEPTASPRCIWVRCSPTPNANT